MISDVLHPTRYQGARRRHPYFEGWYFKLVDASESRRFAVIPGIYKGPTPETSQSFVQFMDGITGAVTFYRYPADAFVASRDTFAIEVGPNRFTAESVDLDLQGPSLAVKGHLDFRDLTPWPSAWHSPGIMGPFSWVPAMECYHAVVSLDHQIRGALAIDGERVDLSGGRGYTEKDWGRRFPAAWIWFQSNHLDQAPASITASVALIPWLGTRFTGFIIGFWQGGRLYRFATYTGARIERLTLDDRCIHWVVANRHHRLSMEIARRTPGLLYAPDIADMSGRVGETLQATARVRLAALARGKAGAGDTVYEGEARLGGLEVVGDVQHLLVQGGPQGR